MLFLYLLQITAALIGRLSLSVAYFGVHILLVVMSGLGGLRLTLGEG